MLNVHCGCCTSGFSLLMILKLRRQGQLLCFLSSVQKIWCTVQTMLCDNIDFKWFWWETSPTPTPAPSADDTPEKEIFPCKIFRPWTWMCVAAGAAQGTGQTVPAILVTRKWNGLWNGKALQIILKQILLQWWAGRSVWVHGLGLTFTPHHPSSTAKCWLCHNGL